MQLREIDTYLGFLAMRPAWNTLLQRSGNDCVFLTWEWLDSWLNVFGEGCTLFILAGYDGETPVGVAPLLCRTRTMYGVRARVLEFIGSGDDVTPDHLGVFTLPRRKQPFLAAVFDYLAAHSSRWDMLFLKDMAEDGEVLAHVAHLPPAEFTCASSVNGVCPYLSLPSSWDEYLQGLSRKSRYNIGKKSRTMEGAFETEFAVLDDRHSLEEGLGKLAELHRRRMAEKHLDGRSLDGRFWRFHEAVVHAFKGRGSVLLGVLSANGRVVACQYGFRYGGTIYHYQSGIDPDYHRYSVGYVSTAGFIRHAIDTGLREFDFLRGSEEYKFHFTRSVRNNIELCVWNSGRKSRLLRRIFGARAKVKSVGRMFAARREPVSV